MRVMAIARCGIKRGKFLALPMEREWVYYRLCFPGSHPLTVAHVELFIIGEPRINVCKFSNRVLVYKKKRNVYFFFAIR